MKNIMKKWTTYTFLLGDAVDIVGHKNPMISNIFSTTETINPLPKLAASTLVTF
jgi:hypothetical protein